MSFIVESTASSLNQLVTSVRKITAVQCDNHKNLINTIFRQGVKFIYLKTGVKCSNNQGLNSGAL
jgi:DNA-binding winged helix-turn-helix (wHTH) protein